MTVIVYRNDGVRFVELFRVDGNKVSNELGEDFLKKINCPVDEDEVFKRIRSNMVYLVVRT